MGNHLNKTNIYAHSESLWYPESCSHYIEWCCWGASHWTIPQSHLPSCKTGIDHIDHLPTETMSFSSFHIYLSLPGFAFKKKRKKPLATRQIQPGTRPHYGQLYLWRHVSWHKKRVDPLTITMNHHVAMSGFHGFHPFKILEGTNVPT